MKLKPGFSCPVTICHNLPPSGTICHDGGHRGRRQTTSNRIQTRLSDLNRDRHSHFWRYLLPQVPDWRKRRSFDSSGKAELARSQPKTRQEQCRCGRTAYQRSFKRTAVRQQIRPQRQQNAIWNIRAIFHSSHGRKHPERAPHGRDCPVVSVPPVAGMRRTGPKQRYPRRECS